ncbi:MAG: transcription termination/antitermination protein NusG, partial [Candidatus Acidiferrum sp.]
EEQPPWYVLHTRPRVEKALAQRLLARSISFFLPLERRQWRKNGRAFTSHIPLFPGYVFLRAMEEERAEALETNLIANLLHVPDQGKLAEDLRGIFLLMRSGKPLTPERRLRAGTPVVIRSGSLAGVEGVVVRDGRNAKVVIAVRFLQQGVSVEIDNQMLEPLENCHQLANGLRN